MNLVLFLSLCLLLRAQILSFLSPKLDSVQLFVQDSHPITTFKFNSFVLVGNGSSSIGGPGSRLFRSSSSSNLGLILCNGPDTQTRIFQNVDYYGAAVWNKTIIVVHQNSSSHCNPPQALCWTPIEFSVFGKTMKPISSMMIAPKEIIPVVRGVASTPQTIYILLSVVYREHMQLKAFSISKSGALLTHNILEYVVNVTRFEFISGTAHIVGYTKFHMKELKFVNTTYPPQPNITKFLITIGNFTDDKTWKLQFNPSKLPRTQQSDYHITLHHQQDFSVGLLHSQTKAAKPSPEDASDAQPEGSWAWGLGAVLAIFFVIILLTRAYCTRICSNFFKSRLNQVDSIVRRDREDAFA